MRSVEELKRGVTLIEMLVVFAIIAILLGLLLPAIHYSRESAKKTACAANLHQLGIALRTFVDARKNLPAGYSGGTVSGWAIELLPFLEDKNLADGFSSCASLDSPQALVLARQRPAIMTCPSAYAGESDIATVPASHYTVQFFRSKRKLTWAIGELRTDSRIAWIASPEVPDGGPAEFMPHGGGYHFMISNGGNVRFIMGN